MSGDGVINQAVIGMAAWMQLATLRLHAPANLLI